jgi:endonuclease/exonuclease/phosphatase family metal-dependent hydrolase
VGAGEAVTRDRERIVRPARAWFAGDWRDAPAPSPSPPRGTRLVTWNVWFGGHMWEERTAALLAELGRLRPDVIALQEVTDPLLAALADEPWIQSGYQISDVDGTTMDAYGVVLLSRIPLRRVRVVALPSEMGRRLVVGELATGLVVATVHLESTAPCIAERIAQLAIIQPYLAGLGNDVVLVGDMNFDAGDPETAAIDPSFVDAWPALRDAEPGFTVDSEVNEMRFGVKGRASQKRIDRVFVRGATWRPQAIELLGTTAIDAAGTFVSDHFGLLATLAIG